MDFKEEDIKRYHRHIILKDVGLSGQKKIAKSKILVIGAGGLGSPILLYLAAAGVGTIGISDFDQVDISNLQRQIIHSTLDIGRFKTDSVEEKIRALNPNVKVNKYKEALSVDNIIDMFNDYDFIVDATDNFPTKFLINDAAIFTGKAFSHGGVLRFYGQTMTVIPNKTACYRCIFEGPPPKNAIPNCTEIGIFGAIPGILGSIQAAEVIKYITGVGSLLTNSLLTFNAKNMEFRKVKLKKNDLCPICGKQPNITRLEIYE